MGGGSELLLQWVVWVLGLSLGLGIGFCLGIDIECELLGGGGWCDLVNQWWQWVALQ